MIEEKFLHFCNTPSDINEHLPTLLRYGRECKHITEFGVRDVVSTWAFLAAKPDYLICYDIVKSKNIDLAIKSGVENGTEIKFFETDVLKTNIQLTDLLFIDTLHTYTQLRKELKSHSHKVGKYIIFHDVETYGWNPEPSHFKTHLGVVKQHEKILENYVENDKGIMPAINEFLKDNPEWKIKEAFANNNGLLIIERNG